MSKKKVKESNSEPVKVTAQDLINGYTLLLAAQAMGITDDSTKALEGAKRLIDSRAREMTAILNYVTTR